MRRDFGEEERRGVEDGPEGSAAGRTYRIQRDLGLRIQLRHLCRDALGERRRNLAGRAALVLHGLEAAGQHDLQSAVLIAVCGLRDGLLVAAIGQAKLHSPAIHGSFVNLPRHGLGIENQLRYPQVQIELLAATGVGTSQEAGHAVAERQGAQFEQQRLALAGSETRGFFLRQASAFRQKPGHHARGWNSTGITIEKLDLVLRRERPQMGLAHARISGTDYCGSVKLGSPGSVTCSSRCHPSFSSLMDWMATALALASRSGCAWNSD